MNAITTVNPAPTAGPHGAGHTIFSHRRQADFLSHLATFGNVRLACRAARVSAQTAYRARRGSAAFRRAWDAACLAARDHAEQVLADRAVNGWEEAVFYHGEEVARRRRYSDRLLLAHLARLDRLAEREDLADMLGVLDGVIDAMRGGAGDAQAALEQASAAREGAARAAAPARTKSPQDRVPSVPPCRNCGGKCDDDRAELGRGDCQYFFNRLDRMDDARPAGASKPHQLGGGTTETGLIEAWQLEAFEAGVEEWWTISDLEEFDTALKQRQR